MELLKLLSETPGVSGNEESVINVIKNEIKDYVDEIMTDSLGNLIAHKKGQGDKLMLCAHADEIGIMITFADEKGFLRFAPVGGVDAYSSINKRVVFSNGVVGVISYEGNIDVKKELNFSKMYIDIGATSQEEALKLVGIGDVASFSSELVSMGDFYVGKALDNRSGVYSLINTIKSIKKTAFDTYFVFTTQEELGLRGAKTSAYHINPKYSICVDVTDNGDTPNCPNNCVGLGKGPAIKIMDKSVICHPIIRRALEKCALESGIPVQKEVLSFGGTDAGAVHITGDGVITGAVSIPLRNMHSVNEIIHKDDLAKTITLLTKFIENNYLN